MFYSLLRNNVKFTVPFFLYKRLPLDKQENAFSLIKILQLWILLQLKCVFRNKKPKTDCASKQSNESVCLLTFEPLFCREDHGVALWPIKFNNPVRKKQKCFKHLDCNGKLYSCMFQAVEHCREGTHPSMCCKKPSCPQLCSSWDTMSWKRGGVKTRLNMPQRTNWSRSSYSGSTHPVENTHTLCLRGNACPKWVTGSTISKTACAAAHFMSQHLKRAHFTSVDKMKTTSALIYAADDGGGEGNVPVWRYLCAL